MSVLDDQRAVIELACLTEHRSNAEQDALLRFAAKTDAAANRLTTTNHRTGPAWRLYRTVEATRVLYDDDKPRVVSKTLDKLDVQADRWDRWHRPAAVNSSEAVERGSTR